MVPGRADLNFRLQGAVYLLADAWAAEAWDSDLERFHLINDTGLLSLPELCAVGRLVWPDVAFDGDGA